MNGRKDDAEKPRWSLLPWEALKPVVDVLTFGARKYAPDNWKRVPEWKDRYDSAMERHLVAWRSGEWADSETNLPHLAHALCCGLFLLAMELRGRSQVQESLWLKTGEGLVLGQCVQCGARRNVVNSEGWCYGCFSGTTPPATPGSGDESTATAGREVAQVRAAEHGEGTGA